MSGEPALMSLVAVAKAIAGKKLSSREVTQSCLDRIAQWQPRVNAFMAIEADAGARGRRRRRCRARQGQESRPAARRAAGAQGHVLRRRQGRDLRLARSAAISSPTTTSTALQRLKDAGTVRLGSLQMVEFAYGPTGHNPHYGAVRNPWNVDHITGGSSSGSGSAVAARLTFAALGSDTGGSIRMPAHFCGVTGFKTTVGRISRAGAMPLSQSLDTVGPLAQTVEDCALLVGLMAGADPEDPTTSSLPVPDYMAATTGSLKGLKIGVPTAFYVDDLDSEVARVLDETIATLKKEGAEIVKVELPDQRQLTAACQIVLATEAAAFHKRWMIERPQDYGAQVLMRLQNGLAIPGRDLSRSDALARSGAGGLSRSGQRHRCRDRTGRADAGGDHCRERRRQQPRRGSRDPAHHEVHPPDQLSRPAVALDSHGLHRKRPAGRHAVDRPPLR